MAAIFVFIIGLMIGSFLNVVILRIHQKKTILGRSICQSCKSTIAWYDNIPVLSFLVLKAKCRFCKKKISWQYPFVELATGVLFALTYIQYPSPLLLFSYLIFISILIIIFVYDLRWYIIPDLITIPAILFAFLANFFIGLHWQSLLLGGIIGAGFFLAQFVLSRGKWIGGGDIRLGALMGVMLGWKLLLLALMIAYFLGAIVGIFLILTGKKKFSSRLPFGTFLTAATVISLLYGDILLQRYLELF